MKHSLNIYQRLMAQFLLVSLLLQSCKNSPTPVIPRIEVATYASQEPSMLNWTNQLVSHELTASEGHVVTLHEEENQLLADVEINAATGFSKTYRDFPVYVHEGIDLAKVVSLDKQQQKQLIEVKLPTRDKKGYVYVGQRGLIGGMKRGVIKKGDEGEEKEKEKEKEKEAIQPAHSPLPLLDQDLAKTSQKKIVKKQKTKKAKRPASLSSKKKKSVESKPEKKAKNKNKKHKNREDVQQEELKNRITSQLFQPAYHQQIKLALYQQLVSPMLSEEQQASLTELTQLITAPEKKLRLGGSHEIREAFRANPTLEHQLFEPLRNHLQKLANYQQQFIGTPIELLLKELIDKHQEFMISLVEQVQTLGPTTPFKLFESKPLLQGEGFEAYEVESEKAYQLACYSPHEYEYVRGNSSGLSIGSMQGGVYFKVDDGRGLLKPAKEHAVYTLYQQLGLENLIAPTHLLVMNGLAVLPADIGESPERRELQRKKQELNTPSTQEVFNHYPELEQRIRFAQREYPLHIQGSLVVAGKTLEKFLEEAEQSPDAEAAMNQLEPTSFTSHVLASLLLLPTDYKSDNLMVDPTNRIIGIDNDDCLEAQELRELGDGKSHGINIKNILYLLPLMQFPVASDISAKFINRHPGVLMLNWLLALQDKQANYAHLLHASLLDQENVDLVQQNVEESLGLPLYFASGWITAMYERFVQLQGLLRNNPSITHQSLFEEIHPFASRYYQGLKKLYPQPLDQMAFVYDKMGNLNTELSNDLESLLAEHPASEDQELLKRLSEMRYQDKEASLSIEQTIQEFISNIDLNAYTSDQQLAWIECVIELKIWPSHLHASWNDPMLLIRMVQAGASTKVIQALVGKAGAKIDAQDEAGAIVLHTAVRKGGKNACKQLSMLVQLGANLEAQNKQDLTPLDLAAEQKDIAAFKHLIMLGAGEKAIAAIINRFYQTLSEKKKQELIPYIAKLTHVNPKVGWKISLNEIFPVQGKAKATLNTVTEGDRVITKEVWNSLFEKDGSPKKVNAYGVRPVSFVEKDGQRIYVKFFPQLPGTELAVIRLAENLLGYCAPYCELASINGIPVLLSQGVPGETLYEVLQKDPERLNELDPESVSKALILAMLINPGDGNLGNYIVSPFINQEGQLKYRLISIDNDQAFMPAVARKIKTGMLSTTLSLQVKTILYCLDAMKDPVSQKLMQQIQGKDLVELLGNWLSSLNIHHEAAKNHFDSGLLKKYQEDKSSVIGVSFAPGMIKQLFTKLMRLHVALNKKLPPTHVELLSSLEPVIAHRYRSVLENSQLTTIEKFKKAEHITEEEALTSSSNVLPQLLMSREIPAISELQAALWSGKFGPNQALEELKGVQKQHTNLDQIFKDLGKSKIQDIKNLPASLLEKWLQEADLTKLSNLQQKTLLEVIQYQELTYIFLKNCSVMTGSWLPYFKLEHIKKLDLSGCKSLGRISTGILGNYPVVMPTLTHFQLNQSGVIAIQLQAEQLKKLSARSCIQLTNLELTAPQLHRLDIRGAVSLNEAKIKIVFRKFPNTFIYLTPTPAFPKQECADYLNRLGLTHDNKGEYKLAVHYFEQAAEQGHANAQNNLGMIYYNGQGVVQNYQQAVEWYQKAADQGHIGAQWSIGNLYAIGKAVEQDTLKAKEWFEKFEKLDDSIRTWPSGGRILTQLKNARDAFSLTNYWLNIYQLDILLEHPRLKQVHTLSLIDNNIGTEGAIKLAKALSNTQVHTLNLENNGIGVLGVSKLAEELPNTQVHTLNLENNGVGAEGAIKLAQALPNTQIHTLNLENNGIGVEGVSKLAQALPNTQIHTLNLENNGIGVEGVSKLAQALPNTQIHTLDLSDNNIGDLGVQEFAKALPLSKILTLDLSDNNIDPLGAKRLAKELSNSKIHMLDLSLNNIGATGAKELAKELSNSKIHMLDLSDNNIGEIGIKELAKVLPNSRIHTLDLSDNEIGDAGAQELAKGLPQSQIHTLNLLYNHIGALGAEELANVLPHSHVHVLDLSDNKIGVLGVKELAKVLPNSQIHTLDLRYNQISDSGAQALAKALAQAQVHTLDLSYNQIGDAGAQALAKALAQAQIHTLDLSYNQIGDSGAQGLAKVLPQTQVHILDLSDNQIGDSGTQKLAIQQQLKAYDQKLVSLKKKRTGSEDRIAKLYKKKFKLDTDKEVVYWKDTVDEKRNPWYGWGFLGQTHKKFKYRGIPFTKIELSRKFDRSKAQNDKTLEPEGLVFRRPGSLGKVIEKKIVPIGIELLVVGLLLETLAVLIANEDAIVILLIGILSLVIAALVPLSLSLPFLIGLLVVLLEIVKIVEILGRLVAFINPFFAPVLQAILVFASFYLAVVIGGPGTVVAVTAIVKAGAEGIGTICRRAYESGARYPETLTEYQQEQEGIYLGKYKSKVGQDGNLEVQIYVKKKDIPGNKERIKKLTEDLAKEKEMIQQYKKEMSVILDKSSKN